MKMESEYEYNLLQRERDLFLCRDENRKKGKKKEKKPGKHPTIFLVFKIV
jgi:hypothetical protein